MWLEHEVPGRTASQRGRLNTMLRCLCFILRLWRDGKDFKQGADMLSLHFKDDHLRWPLDRPETVTKARTRNDDDLC